MFLSRPLRGLFRVLSLLLVAASVCLAQQTPPPTPAPAEPTLSPNASSREAQDEERVFTEEVRIPLFATDEQGRFDPTLEIEDILVLEDDVPQEIRSVRRIPSSVLLLIGTGSELNPAMRTRGLRDIALSLVSNLREGDQMALIQFTNHAEGLQKWTTERERIAYALHTKLKSGRGSKLSQAIIHAASYFEHQPVGNRHLVLITDGVETPGRMDAKEALSVLGTETPEARAQAAEAVRQLQQAQVTVHVVSFTQLGRKVSKEKRTKKEFGAQPGSVASSGIATVGIDPTLPPGMSRGSAIGGGASAGVTLTFDPAMKRLRKAYEQATKKSEQRLASFTEETGGRMWLPASDEETITAAAGVAREIGSQYVVTYKPKRPLASAPPNEYRRLRVAPRRIGLNLRARRGYVVAAMR
ncbi:MAG TPA: VWA domain-containing protein [Pyrinomonadaceae bacterium]|jgi:VWFA-related protein